jgi:hypothetical protein
MIKAHKEVGRFHRDAKRACDADCDQFCGPAATNGTPKRYYETMD